MVDHNLGPAQLLLRSQFVRESFETRSGGVFLNDTKRASPIPANGPKKSTLVQRAPELVGAGCTSIGSRHDGRAHPTDLPPSRLARYFSTIDPSAEQ
jgi:hypothetical protein